jgi:membrane protein required for beta-lactamase induction
MALKKVGLLTASALCSINLWTGAPLLAVWIGSKVQGSLNNLSMVAVFSVIVVLAGTVFGLALLLTWLNVKYDDLTGRPVVARQTSPWLRSMRDERDDATQRKYGIGGIERVVIICAVAGILAFEAWFFFFAGSSLPNG